ncbi:host cell division inhibitor Icd-like protein [Mannheimia pernigra]|uniref:host cell division inhibitor Icd-like protein n=1 Tax=Mannheimia pernigra TaxID=111844 RepID=UPI00159F3B33|nr:host cell division inhibitor Icd-like protein [Mannheimia pernigra]QLB43582.1 host cell division inhibitor Icd-like protein [Mannheimia pernigra]
MYTHILTKKHPSTNEKTQKPLAPCFRLVYIAFAFAKSEAEPRNSQYISVANNSTPLNYRAFFVCCTRTPKKRYNIAVFSMVACNGKGFALCCIPLIAVFEPVTRYRLQASKLQAVAPKNSSVELSAMKNFAYSFLCTIRTLTKKHPYTNEKPQKRLAPCFKSVYIAFAFAKSEAECGNSNTLLANSSTPLNYRAFFVRSSRTPKKCYNIAVFSMVACSGQGFALDCFPIVAVFHPVARYRPTLWKMLAIAPKNQLLELSAMIYKFLLLGSKRLEINTHTNEKTQKPLAPCFRLVYIVFASAKSEAEPRNSQYLNTANKSTPLNRAIFVCSTSTPKKRYNIAVFSMVACNGKGFALCCIPCIAVFEPITSYRPQASKLQAVAPKNSNTELSAMKNFAYSFLCVNRTAETYQEEVIRVIANSEENARFQLSADYRLILPRPIAKIRQKSTACTAQGGIYA